MHPGSITCSHSIHLFTRLRLRWSPLIIFLDEYPYTMDNFVELLVGIFGLDPTTQNEPTEICNVDGRCAES